MTQKELTIKALLDSKNNALEQMQENYQGLLQVHNRSIVQEIRVAVIALMLDQLMYETQSLQKMLDDLT